MGGKGLVEEDSEGENEVGEVLIEGEVMFGEDVEKILGKGGWSWGWEEIMGGNEEVGERKEVEKKEENRDGENKCCSEKKRG